MSALWFGEAVFCFGVGILFCVEYGTKQKEGLATAAVLLFAMSGFFASLGVASL